MTQDLQNQVCLNTRKIWPSTNGAQLLKVLPAGRYSDLTQIAKTATTWVFKAYNHMIKEWEALKVTPLKDLTQKQLRNLMREIAIHSKLQHPFIVGYHHHYITSEFAIIAMECMDGELFEYVHDIQPNGFDEKVCRKLMVQLCSAMSFIHSQNVAHRDLKLENIFYRLENGKIKCVKIGDFGLSKQFSTTTSTTLTTPCGTLCYVAPEVVRGGCGYSCAVDYWGMGCVCYILLCGFPPFYETDDTRLKQKIANGDWSFLSPWWDDVSAPAKEVISSLLEVETEKRASFDMVLRSQWLEDDYFAIPTTGKTIRVQTPVPLQHASVLSPAAHIKFQLPVSPLAGHRQFPKSPMVKQVFSPLASDASSITSSIEHELSKKECPFTLQLQESTMLCRRKGRLSIPT